MFHCSNTTLIVLFLVVGFTQETIAKLPLRRDGSAIINGDAEVIADVKTLEKKEQNRLLVSKKLNYTDPVWFDSYKARAGKALKRCKFQNNVAPANGSRCRRQSLDYNCAFGDQTCPNGSIHPKTLCYCDVSAGTWSCEKYKPCKVTRPVKTCPKKHPITFNPPLTCVKDLSCLIGKQKCCGDKFPLYICTCKNGVFDCDNDNSCAGTCPETAKCPIIKDTTIAETPVGSCNFPPEKQCQYGKQCWYVCHRVETHHSSLALNVH